MGVTPIGALLEAHVLSNWNRLQQEFGVGGRAAYWVLGVVVAFVVIAPATILSYFSGLFVADRLRDPDTIRILGAVLAGLTLVGGVVGASRVLDWERIRTFPIPLRSVLAAELVAGLGDFVPALLALVTLALLLGIGTAKPRVLPLLIVPGMSTVGGFLCLRRLLAGLIAKAFRDVRSALVVLVTVSGLAGFVIAIVDRPSGQALLELLPSTQSLHGVQEALSSHWAAALAYQIYPIIFLISLLALTARTLRRESEPRSGGSRTGDAAPEVLWSFSTPTRGVARLHWASLMRSSLGLLGLVSPVVILFVLRRPISEATPGAVLPGLGLLSAVLFVNTALHFDQFGLDGPGVKSLLLLPLRSEELLAGKTLALAVYQGAQLVLLCGVVSAFGLLHGFSPSKMLAALCVSGCQFLLNVGVGHWFSIRMPRPLPRNPFKQGTKTRQSPVHAQLCLGCTAFGGALFGGGYILTARYLPGWELVIMAFLLGTMLLLYRRLVLPRSARYLDGHHERLVQSLL